MLKPSGISKADPRSSVGSSKPVKINSVITKGKVRVTPKPGLQVVASTEPQDSVEASVVEPVLEKEASPSFISSGRLSRVEAAWQPEDNTEASSPQSLDGATNEPPLKLVKLVAAAAVLGVVTLGLVVLQFTGASSEGANAQERTANTEIAPAPSARTLEIAETLQVDPQQEQSSALVAQIAAGTLAALRNGQSGGPGSTAVEAPSVSSQSGAPQGGLYGMVLSALEQGQSERYIDQMVNEAYRAQKVTVPALLIKASGDVDTKALLTLFGEN